MMAAGRRTTIYLADDVLSTARIMGMNVSAVCEAGLRAEIERRTSELQASVEAGRVAAETLARVNGHGSTSVDAYADLDAETDADVPA